jgi:hypothetical protein
MRSRTIGSIPPALLVALAAMLACTLGQARPSNQLSPAALAPTAAQPADLTAATNDFGTEMGPSPTPAVTHLKKPADFAVTGNLVYDVESVDTAPERRAPYGDSYDINRLERPFLQDMTYVPDLDISTYTVGNDADWYYVTLHLIGSDPNNALGINYAVELDTDHDGFGDYVIWAHPPYTPTWETAPVQIFKDTNHNTGGLSAMKSDAPLSADGYDTLVFNGGSGDADPDLAWVRVNADAQGTVQFAFKRSWSGGVFMLGTLADAGIKDPKQLDYVDRIPAAQAGSPVRNNQYYPLKALYQVDNVCREAYGFNATGYEPQLCPREEPQPTHKPRSTSVPVPGSCLKSCIPGYHQLPYPNCSCASDAPW